MIEGMIGGIFVNKRRWSALLLSALLLSLLAACGGGGGSSSSTPDPGSASLPDEPSVPVIAPVEPDPEPVHPYVNPLTGEGVDQDVGARRPIAVMINNLKKALPQAGVSQADIIYELPAEGGVTRMLALFQSVEGVGEIGTVRSARDYYVSLALGHDAIFLHAGGSPMAYAAIKQWGVTALDCVNGPYEGTLFWRDPDRRKNAGLEHSVLTSGEKICELLPTYSRVTLEHKEGYTEPLAFLGEDEIAQGSPAERVSVKFSASKTGVFTYDPEIGLYRVEEFGAPYIDANTGEQVAVKNVLVLFTDVGAIKGDDKGRQSVRTTGTGEGIFLCDGTVQDIRWSKKDNSTPLSYTDAAGQPLKLGVGHSYINILGSAKSVTLEASLQAEQSEK